MISPAPNELIALAAAMRGPDWARALEGAMANPQVRANWDRDWLKIYGYVFRMLPRDDARPKELIEAWDDPIAHKAAPRGGFEAAAKIRAEAKARMAEAQAAGPRVTADTPQRAKREPAA